MLKTRKKAVLAAFAVGALIASPIWLPIWIFLMFVRAFGWLVFESFELVDEATYYLQLARRYRRWQQIRKYAKERTR